MVRPKVKDSKAVNLKLETNVVHQLEDDANIATQIRCSHWFKCTRPNFWSLNYRLYIEFVDDIDEAKKIILDSYNQRNKKITKPTDFNRKR